MLGGGCYLALPFDPISLVLAQRNGVEPTKKGAFLPRRLHHPRERYCLGCRYSSSPDLGRGLVFVGGLCGCAVLLGGGCYLALPFDPISLVLAQRNGVEPPKKSAFLPRCLHHSRERYRSVDGMFLARLWGGGWCLSGVCTCAPFSWVEVSSPYCPFHPISLLLRKETGWSPKETRLWVPPRELFGPARLSHGLEAPTLQPTASS